MKSAFSRMLVFVLVLGLVACGSSAATPLPPAAEPEETYGLSSDQIATLSSLEQVDDYPLYTMHYHGMYQRVEMPSSSSEANAGPAWGCSLFAALGDNDGMVFGRNFDWEYSPAVLLYTDPPDGYASVSMVDIAYLGFDNSTAPQLLQMNLGERQQLLNAPFLPFDGMNELGLVVGMAAVPAGNVPADPQKEPIGSLGVIREILDHAADVDEAVEVLRGYNIDFEGGPPLHYLIADRSGRAVLVEFYRGEIVMRPNEAPWHQATNFIVSSTADAGGHCWRYDRIAQQLAESSGALAPAGAVELLSAVSQDITQWSIVYGMHSGEVQVVMDRDFESPHTLRFELAQP